MSTLTFRQTAALVRSPRPADVPADPQGWLLTVARDALRASDCGQDPDPALLVMLAGLARWVSAHSTDAGARGLATAVMRAYDQTAEPRRVRSAA